MLRHLGQHLVDSLLDALRKQCQEPAPHFAELKNLLAALAEEFDVALVTTNYDDLLYCAFPQGIETGFDLGNNGVFCQDRILRRATWPCILHLHGSVHFDMDQRRDDFHAIHWREDLTRFHQNSFGRNPQHAVEGNVFPTSSIIAGYGKTIQIQRFPFRTYYSELDRLVYGSDAALFLGYGFNDVHLNNAFADYRDSRNRPVVMIDKAPDNTLTLCSFGEGHETARRALQIFHTPFHQMSALGKNYPDTVKDLIAKTEFERCVDPALRLSFWYNGMLEACRNPDKVLREFV